MTNIKTIPLIPLIREEKEQEVLKLIAEKNFDIKEVTENGYNLLIVAISYGCLQLAQELINIDEITNATNFFSKDITKECKYIFSTIIENEEKIARFHEFFIKNDIKLYPDFNEIIEYLDELEMESFNSFNKIETFNILTKFFKNTKEEIKKISSFDMIKKISKLNSPNLLKMYFNICEFEKLPIQEHPSFKLLKDVVTNPFDYYDFITFNSQKVNYSLNENAIIKIKEEFEKINKVKDFSKYFKKDRDFLKDIESMHVIPHFYNVRHPHKEMNLIKKMINLLNDKVKVENPDRFLSYYLTNWPVYYFKDKAVENKPMSEKIKKEFEKILLDCSLDNIYINKEMNIENVLSSISLAIKEIEEMFNLKGVEIGNNEVDLIFDNKIDENNPVLGSYQPKHNIINIFHKEFQKTDMVSIIIHEYTHYLQYQDKDKNKEPTNELQKVKELSKEWVDYRVTDFVQYLFNKVKNDYADYFVDSLFANKEKEFLKIITDVFSLGKNTENALEILEEKIQKLYNKKETEIIKNMFLYEADEINLYYETQKNKEFSYEYASWVGLDKESKKNYDYWIEPLEIHARLNQAIYEEKNKKILSYMNPAKLNQMKKMIKEFNNMFGEKLKEKNKKRNSLI